MLKQRKATTVYDPPFSAHGYDGIRFVAHPDDSLRRVGFSDEILPRLDHRGWYTDEFESEVYRGVVYQLPARNGQPCFVPGYWDPYGDAALLCFGDSTDSKDDAAAAADRFAEIFAEHEREYQAAAHAAFQVTDLRGDMASMRTRTRHLRAMIRAARPGPHRNTLKAYLEGERTRLAELARKESDLVDRFGEHPGFTDNI